MCPQMLTLCHSRFPISCHYISESQDRTSKVKAIDRLQQNVMSDTGQSILVVSGC